MHTDPVIRAQNLVKAYGEGKTAVGGLSFSLNKGEILSLLGPNGAGKTTTIKMLLGLVTPDAGTATVCGQNMAVEKEMRRGLRHVGAVLEGARNAYWRLSAMENLLYFGSLKQIPRRRLRQRAESLLTFLGLDNDAHLEVRKFSRGMQQKLALALALLNDPQVLLLDEPTLGLDVQAARTLEEKIVDLAGQGKAIILTTHTMPLAEKLSTHILVLNKGKKVAYGERRELLQQFNTRTIVEVHLERPFPRAIKQQVHDQFPAVEVTDTEEGGSCLVWMEPEQKQVIRLLNLLDQQQQIIRQVLRRESNLEEVFLTLTGGRP